MVTTRARELLDLLEELWRRQGAPMDLAPGASAAELDEAERQLGFALPQEVRDWFGWHNGPQDFTDPPVMLPTWLIPGTLQQSVEGRAERLVVQERSDTLEGSVFRAGWVPIAEATNRMLVVDCTAGGGDCRPRCTVLTTGSRTTGTSCARRP